MLSAVFLLAGAALLAWVWLWLCRGRFWRTGEVLPPGGDGDCPTGGWPAVNVVVPARNEAEMLPATLSTLLRQDYPGDFHVFLVDDHSEDGTGETARQIARRLGLTGKLTVVAAEPLEPGWTGKLWALEQGLRVARQREGEFLLLTDADISYSPEDLRRLVTKACRDRLDLVSLMVMLRAEAFWERLLIPAFVYFFAMLYPFARVNDPGKQIAAAAGGCLLLRREALERSGGLAPIRGELIDDCSLARQIKARGRKAGGRIWLGLSRSICSLRAYNNLAEIWQMVARTAFVQLRYSYLLLALTLVGMGLVYLIPPFAALGGLIGTFLHPQAGRWWALALTGMLAWALMARTYLPMVRWYGLPLVFAVFLPFTAGLYTLMTLDSARRFRAGGGGLWKGRTYRASEAEKEDVVRHKGGDR